MNTDPLQWYHADADTRLWQGPLRRRSLDDLIASGKIKPDTKVIREGMIFSQGILYHDIDCEFHVYTDSGYRSCNSYSDLVDLVSEDVPLDSPVFSFKGSRPESTLEQIIGENNLSFDPTIREFLETRLHAKQTVICGRNNAGKSTVLKEVRKYLGAQACLLLTNRFSNIGSLRYNSPRSPYNEEHFRHFLQQANKKNNIDNAHINVERLLSELSQEQLNLLFDVYARCMKITLEIQKSDRDKPFSDHVLLIDGQPSELASTGTRLALTLVLAALSDDFTHLIVDEPELGLSPDVQSAISGIFFDEQARATYFPHLQHVWVATHSHLFLDVQNINNNFQVSRVDAKIALSQITDLPNLHDTQLNLLGNNLASLFLPSAIVLAEGESERIYLSSIARSLYPEQKLIVIDCEGDSRVNQKVIDLSSLLGGIETSPYRARVLVVLDKVNSVNTQELIGRGIPKDNIIIWDANGIEYAYPPRAMASIFKCSIDKVFDEIVVSSNHVEANGIRYTKAALAQKIAEKIDSTTEFTAEFDEKFHRKLKTVVASR